MRASRVKTDSSGNRLIWGYESIPEEISSKPTPLQQRTKELEDREREERRARRHARREQRDQKRAEKRERRREKEREERDKRREQEERDREHADADTDKAQKQKYDLKAAAKLNREEQRITGPAQSTVQGKSILLNLLQTTLHDNRVKDGEQIDKARVMFRQAGFDEGGRKDVTLLSVHLNSNAMKRPPTPPPRELQAEVAPASYDEFKQKKQEEKVQERKAKIKAKIKEQKARATAFIRAQEAENLARKAAEHYRVDGKGTEDADVSASIDSLLASVAASLETKVSAPPVPAAYPQNGTDAPHPPLPPFPPPTHVLGCCILGLGCLYCYFIQPTLL